VRGWLLDTNVISALIGPKPEPRLASWFKAQAEHTMFLSILTVAEYWKGIEHLAPGHITRSKHRQTLVRLESRFAGRILPVSNTIALRWGSISGEVKRITRHSPSVVDTMLAATAIEHNLYLATRNTSDVAHSATLIFNPWKDDPANFPLA
jgi:predicted nucleic acid-binding protein